MDCYADAKLIAIFRIGSLQQRLLGPDASATGKDIGGAGVISANCQGIAVEREASTKA